jgi:serine/threonine protein kinase
MELCGHGSLSDIMLLTGKGLRDDQISMICRCALKGLAYLHSVNIIHRDVKAGN